MNLVELMSNELKAENIIDKEEIKDYVYKRTGEIFSYDPNTVFCTPEEKMELCKMRIDIRNVDIFSINCFTWSYAFVDLLAAFNISARVKVLNEGTAKEHAYVESYINNQTFISDLMGRFEDITRIKFGFSPIFNLQLANNSNMHPKEQHSKNDVSLEQFIEMIKQKISILNIQDKEKSTYVIFKCVEKIMNSPIWEKRNIDYFSGIRFLSQIIYALLGNEQRPYNSHYVNKDEGVYIELYTLIVDDKNYYFAYQKENNGYKLNEVSSQYLVYLEAKFESINGYNLSRKR